jgi:hypothetical protein
MTSNYQPNAFIIEKSITINGSEIFIWNFVAKYGPENNGV